MDWGICRSPYVWLPGGVGRSAGLGSSFYIADELNERRTVRRTNLILAGAGYFEVALTTFVINLRYMLMSLSLSQKLDEKTGTGARLALAFGITDETFVVSSCIRAF